MAQEAEGLARAPAAKAPRGADLDALPVQCCESRPDTPERPQGSAAVGHEGLPLEAVERPQASEQPHSGAEDAEEQGLAAVDAERIADPAVDYEACASSRSASPRSVGSRSSSPRRRTEGLTLPGVELRRGGASAEPASRGGIGNVEHVRGKWLYLGHLRHDSGRPEEYIIREHPDRLAELRWRSALADSEVVPFLQSIGFAASGLEVWTEGQRALQLHLGSHTHSEVDGHTWYRLHCHLTSRNAEGRHWQVERRLRHIRSDLHDIVKHNLGKSYPAFFGDTPFAAHGGPTGTTDRINAWLTALATCINECHVPPATAAQVLRFLEAPGLSEGTATTNARRIEL